MAGDIVEVVFKVKDEASQAIDKIGDSAAETAGKSDKASISAKGLGGAFTAVATGAAVAVAGLVKLAQAAADSVNDLNDMATRTGLAADTIKALKVAAEGSGQSISALEPALKRLTQEMARTGDTSQTADQRLRDILGSISAIEDPTERAAVAVEAFGRDGARMLQALGPNALANLEALEDLTREFGVNTGPAASAAAAEYQIALSHLGIVTDALPQKFSAAFGTDTTGLIDAFTGSIVFAGELFTSIIDQIGRNLDRLAQTKDAILAGEFLSAADIVGEIETFLTLPELLSDAAASVEDFYIRSDKARRTASAAGSGSGSGSGFIVAPEDMGESIAEGFNQHILTAAPDIGHVIGVGAFTGFTGPALIDGPSAFGRIFSEALAKVRAGVGGAASVVGQLAMGDVSGLLSAAGPYGAAIGGIAQIGEMGAGGVEAQLIGFKDALIAGLEALPEILGEVIPEFAVSLVEELIPALIDNAPAILASLNDLIIGLPWAIGEAILSALGLGGAAEWAGNVREALGTGQNLAEIVTLGMAKTATFGDTPGVVQASSFGSIARFAPGDYVAAARSPGRLLAQAEDFAGGRSGANVSISIGSGAFVGPSSLRDLTQAIANGLSPGGSLSGLSLAGGN